MNAARVCRGRTTGRLVALEGIDGAGKSEQLHRLGRWLRARGLSVVETCEPTEGEWGRRYRAWARGEFDASPEEVLEFFVEDRREHVARVIRPGLAAGSIVLCDRYVHSTLAYQAAQGIAPAQLARRFEREQFPEPDLVLWLRLSPDEALRRLGGDAVERFERRNVLVRVDREYARLGLDPIDATGSPEQVEARLRDRLEPLLPPDDPEP